MRALVITPLAVKEDLAWVDHWDLVLCADGGYEAALRMGLTPDRLIGDMDSRRGQIDAACQVSLYPVMKDETDTVLCLQEGRKLGVQDFWVLGGMGGRLDHTYANIQTMAYGLEEGLQVTLTGQGSMARLLEPGEYMLENRSGMKVSLFAYSDKVEGLTLEGMLYPLQKASLTANFPLGISNAVTAPQGRLIFEKGRLLLFYIPED